jgi:hypothetical protein
MDYIKHDQLLAHVFVPTQRSDSKEFVFEGQRLYIDGDANAQLDLKRRRCDLAGAAEPRRLFVFIFTELKDSRRLDHDVQLAVRENADFKTPNAFDVLDETKV